MYHDILFVDFVKFGDLFYFLGKLQCNNTKRQMIINDDDMNNDNIVIIK